MEVEINKWQSANFQDFWAEIAPADHLVQVYENEEVFLQTLEGFVGSGFLADDAVVIIAKEEHLLELNKRLNHHNFDVGALIASKQYMPLDAHDVLGSFMVGGWPNENAFFETVKSIFNIAKKDKRRVRAFGEMVAVLWEQKNYSATVHLEHLWNKFCEKETFCLYCAYPKSGFTMNPAEAIKNICCAHSKIISGDPNSSTQIQYSEAG